MANKPAPEIDYDLIYKLLEKNEFRCVSVAQIRCGVSVSENPSIPNEHRCLCKAEGYCSGSGSGTPETRKKLRELYLNKSLQPKLKAILE
jgi:hypothetical protein